MTAPTKRAGILRFDPTFNSGQIVQIVTVTAVAFGAWQSVKTDLAVQKTQIESAQAAARDQSVAVHQIGVDVKELTKAVGELRTELAVLRGRSMDARPLAPSGR